MGRNMEDNYLKLFGNMFYNIKEDQDNKKIIEEGCYLTLTYQGSYSQNSIYIPMLLEYAKRENLVPVDSVLELVWIDIHLTEDPGEHVTELQMWCQEKK